MQLVYCKNCRKELRLIRGVYVSVDRGIFQEQYCWIDPAFGSELHEAEPVEVELHLDDSVPIVPPQGRYKTQAREIEAFEAYAKEKGLNMEIHPLHYIFLDPVTAAARDAWKEALWLVRKLEEHNAVIRKDKEG